YFVDSAAVDLVLSQFLRAASSEDFAILVYCFMADHVHLLVEALAETSDCKRFLVRCEQLSAHAYASTFSCRLWQPNAYEHVVRDDEKTAVVARYILENPVRAGIVQSPLEYPFSGSQTYR